MAYNVPQNPGPGFVQQGYGPQAGVPQGGVPQNWAPQGAVNMPMQANTMQANMQPKGSKNWAARPRSAPGVPPGLEYLTLIDTLLVKQKVELLEVLMGCETENKYVIMNGIGQQVYFATEDTGCCTRLCCGHKRSFNMMITDNNGMEVIHLYRKLACDTCWFPCCLQHVEVCAPAGTPIGYVKQTWSLCCPHFDIQNAAGDVVLQIQGPFCTRSLFCKDVVFQVQTLDGSVIGLISKKFSGFVKEAFTDADNFGINFPLNLDVQVKATLLAALFLIDYMFFEDGKKDESDGIGMLS